MNTSLTIRSANADDLDAILSLFDTARRFMAANGNPSQWVEGYPNADIVRADIAHGNCYVCTPADRQTIVGTFVFILGEEPTYRLIEQGHWHADRPYGTIHRMTSDGHTHGIARATFDYCAAQTDYLRIDTHADNRPMLRAITRYGFRPCGIIYVRDGSPRLAFDLERPSAGRP
ncbi:N-acetyltransferase [Tannerella serpentiformis]|nr:GNAT family protein [Tannerella serpentiformis]AOH40825.1 N-acetyltransferase [Tannerella serpentiformis]AVV52489.1 N-acetyltransferase [Tannerella serpentiformis]